MSWQTEEKRVQGYAEKGGLFTGSSIKTASKIGVPKKASSIYFKPALDKLESKFKENESLRLQHKKHLRVAICWTLQKSDLNLAKFNQCLKKEGVLVCVRQNADGVIYGMPYIDHTTRCKFNCSDIGREFSAKAILEKCSQVQKFRIEHKISEEQKQKFKAQKLNESSEEQHHSQHHHHKQRMKDSPLEELVRPIEEKNEIPWQLIKKKKQSLRQSQSHRLH